MPKITAREKLIKDICDKVIAAEQNPALWPQACAQICTRAGLDVSRIQIYGCSLRIAAFGIVEEARKQGPKATKRLEETVADFSYTV